MNERPGPVGRGRLATDRLLLGALLAAALIGVCVSAARTPLFGSTVDLLEDAQRKNPDSSLANLQLASALIDRGDLRERPHEPDAPRRDARNGGDPGSRQDRRSTLDADPIENRVADLYQAMLAAPDAKDLLRPAAIDRADVFLAAWSARSGRPEEGERLMRERFGGRTESLDVATAWARYLIAAGRVPEAAARMEARLIVDDPKGPPRMPGIRELRDRLLALPSLPFDLGISVRSPSGDPYLEALEKKVLYDALRVLGEAERGLGRTREALGASSVLAALFPDDPDALRDLAGDYRAAGDEARAHAVEARLGR